LHLFRQRGLQRRSEVKQAICKIGGRDYIFDLGPLEFSCTYDRDLHNRPVLLILWGRGTQFRNFALLAMLCLRLGWPLISFAPSQLYNMEDEEVKEWLNV
jgi:hypothetical protein